MADQAYRKLAKDPMGRVEGRIGNLLKVSGAGLPVEVEKPLIAHVSCLPGYTACQKYINRMFHLCPILGNISASMDGLAKYLDPWVENYSHPIKNSETFAKIVDSLRASLDDLHPD